MEGKLTFTHLILTLLEVLNVDAVVNVICTGTFMQICTLVVCGQVQKPQQIVETSLALRFLLVVLKTLLSSAMLKQEALSLHWATYSLLVRITGKMSSS